MSFTAEINQTLILPTEINKIALHDQFLQRTSAEAGLLVALCGAAVR